MIICHHIDEVRKARKSFGTVGFVPTMGFLHEGHLSLIRQAKAENSAVIVSIFVNPTQFGPHEDFDSYPRDIERDLSLLRQEKVDAVFLPNVSLLYPEDFVSTVSVGGVGKRMEALQRPGHFEGVALVVSKLFNIIQPDKAYFGQKDAQQCAVIAQLVKDLNFPIALKIIPTSREEDGLARSSRNSRLTPEERRKALGIYKALQVGKALFIQGERKRALIEEAMIKTLKSHDLTEIDHAVIVDRQSFEAQTSHISENSLALIAVKMSKVRLIDNEIF